MSLQKLLLVGNVIDGIEVVGPFETTEDAVDYAEIYCKNFEWVITSLSPPGLRWVGNNEGVET